MNWKAILLIGSVILAPCKLFSQDETPTQVTVQNRTGDLPFSQTVGTGVEHVDIGSGNLIVDVPIISVPGRHMPFNYGLRYNALFWTVATRATSTGQVRFWNIERRPYVGGMDQGLGFTPTQPQLSWGVSTETCSGNSDPIFGGGGLGLARMRTSNIRQAVISIPTLVAASIPCQFFRTLFHLIPVALAVQ